MGLEFIKLEQRSTPFDRLRQRYYVPRPPKPKRRWYQFSLQTLLLVMVAATVVVGWIGMRIRWARVNRERVAAVTESVAECEKLGMNVHTAYTEQRSATWLEELLDDPGGPDDPVSVLHLSCYAGGRHRTHKVADAGLEHLKGLTELRILDLSYARITDAGLVHLKGLTELRSLDLSDTNITNAGLVHLKGLTNLRSLDLSYTKVTDAGLEHLKGLSKLRTLRLYRDNITNAGLVHLKGLTNLRSLDLAFTKVNNAGLEHLKGLTRLEYLDLPYVTDAGIKKLQEALPNCKIRG